VGDKKAILKRGIVEDDKKMVIGGVLIIFAFIILIDSGAIYCRTSIEIRHGVEYNVSHYEWHPEALPKYFKKDLTNIKICCIF